ncbi:CPBP family intramembrane glutamic endopeptidase [Enterocloster hominis (ex Hitch et al. 2024)]|uniref:Type II CAAX endopeptidase family protein n=1 Tax=Enterocloster hominis (ex Hitch et al. 2024) TaxID=1917870 RepID=A0ABV1DBC9_9FIRM
MMQEEDYTARQLEEEAKALGRRQRRQFSHVGLVAAAFMIVTFLAQIAVIAFAGFINYLLGGIIDLFSGAGLILLSAIPMYFVAFPVSVALIQLIPKCGHAQRQPWGIGKFAACLVISVGIGLAGNLLGQFVEWFKPSGVDGSQLNELLMNSRVWMTVLFTVLMAPVVEELFFRKLLMDRLLGYGEGPAILMSGLMFGMAHGNFSQFFYAFGIGVLWAYVYAKTGKVGYTIAFHMIFNLLGGAIAVELTKGASGAFDGSWFVQGMERMLSVDLRAVIAAVSGFLMVGYFVFMVACLVGGIVLLILYRRQIHLEPGTWPIKKGTRFKTVVLNVGMILYFLVCISLFVMNW